MAKLKLSQIALATALVASAAAQADHNSVWGEGWASMPNDIHNTRLDTMDDDTDSFIDFVSQGAGADSVNRYLDDSTDTSTGGGSDNAGGSRGGRS